MIKTVVMLLAVGACSSTRKFDIKPVDKPHQPSPAELGPAVDIKTGYEALCAAVPDDSARQTPDGVQAYIRGALVQYPNPEVIRFWEAQASRSSDDRLTGFRGQLDANSVKSCRLYDLMQTWKHS